MLNFENKKKLPPQVYLVRAEECEVTSLEVAAAPVMSQVTYVAAPVVSEVYIHIYILHQGHV